MVVLLCICIGRRAYDESDSREAVFLQQRQGVFKQRFVTVVKGYHHGLIGQSALAVIEIKQLGEGYALATGIPEIYQILLILLEREHISARPLRLLGELVIHNYRQFVFLFAAGIHGEPRYRADRERRRHDRRRYEKRIYLLKSDYHGYSPFDQYYSALRVRIRKFFSLHAAFVGKLTKY